MITLWKQHDDVGKQPILFASFLISMIRFYILLPYNKLAIHLYRLIEYNFKNEKKNGATSSTINLPHHDPKIVLLHVN